MRFADAIADRDAHSEFIDRAQNHHMEMRAPQMAERGGEFLILPVLRNQPKHGSYAQRLSPFGAAAGKNFPAILGCHAAAEAMGVLTRPVGRLKGAFHLSNSLIMCLF